MGNKLEKRKGGGWREENKKIFNAGEGKKRKGKREKTKGKELKKHRRKTLFMAERKVETRMERR